MNHVSKRVVPTLAASSALAALVLGATPSAAQPIDPATIVTPLNDANCTFLDFQPNPVPVVPNCTVDGTRQVTLTDVTRSSVSATQDRVVATYNVTFNGRLQVDGNPVQLQSPASLPVPRDATLAFDPANAPVVEVAGSYVATRSARLPKATPTSAFPTDGQWAYFGAITSSDLQVRAITVNNSGGFTNTGLDTFGYAFRSVDPSAIVNNATALTGRFNYTSVGGPIQFGSISGTATFLVGPLVTPYPSSNGFGYGVVSNFGLQYDIAATLLTQLDGTGLIAPRLEVTEGIEMNGSKVTGVADGTTATDGINKGQLDAEASARVAADAVVLASIQAEAAQRTAEDTAIRTDLAAEAQARAAVDAQIEQRILAEETARAALSQALVNESSARLASDLALNSQVTALGSRIDALEAQVGFLDRRLARSTAMAVAMSGSVFLPGMRYNVSANFGTYDGESAGALQLATLVSDNVAFNAGVATGFEGGGTSVRAGFTFAF